LVISALDRTCVHGASPPYPLPTVYVSATRIPREFTVLGRRVTVLDSAAIAARAATSIPELLAGLPGVHSRTRGPFGVQTDLEMAGASFSQVLVLVDGMRVTDPQTSHHNLNLPLRPGDLERIEVLYGAGSSAHGPDAFGGVINLVPRKDPVRHLELATRWGRSPDAGSVAAVGSGATLRYGWRGAWGDLSLSAGKDRSDGHRPDADFDIDRLFLSARIPLAGGRLRLQSGVEDKEFGAGDFYAPFPSREWTRVWLCGAQFRRVLRPGRELTVRAHYRRHRDRFVLTSVDPALYENRHSNQTAIAETYLHLALGEASHAILGGEAAAERIDSSNLGTHARHRSALFAEYSRYFGLWGLDAGSRLDYSSRYGWEISPSLGLSAIWPATRAYAAVSRAFRTPSFTEFYYRDPANVGSADLEAERAWSWEAGLVLHPGPGLQVQTAVFVRDEDGLIDYVRPVGTPPWTARNLGEVRTLGTQLDFSLGPGRPFRLDLGHAWLRKTRTLEEGFESKYVFTHPTHLFLLHLTHPLPAGLTSGWRLTLREGDRGDDYVLMDLVLSRRCRYGLVRVRLQNLTDQVYEEVPGVPMPGRWLSLESQFAL